MGFLQSGLARKDERRLLLGGIYLGGLCGRTLEAVPLISRTYRVSPFDVALPRGRLLGAVFVR